MTSFPVIPSRARAAGAAALLALTIAIIAFGHAREWFGSAIHALGNLGYWGPVAFVLLYIIAAIFMIPPSVLTLVAGALYGVVYGTGIVSLASTAGASAAFLTGRFLAREAVQKRMARSVSLKALDLAMVKDGWKLVMLVRLSPLFPYTVLNYAFGLTCISFRHYILASWLAMLPATLLLVYIGSLAGAGIKGDSKTIAEWIIYAAGLLATILVTVYVTRTTRKAIAAAGLLKSNTSTEAQEPAPEHRNPL